MSSTPSTASDKTTSEKGRESGIELLRIISACGVVMLHYNNVTYGGGLVYSEGINHYFLLFAQAVFAPAVDLFIIVFGFYNCRRHSVKVIRPIQLIIQVIVFNVAFFLVNCALSKSFSLRSLIGSLMPANYFVVFYVVLFVFSPYINKGLSRLSKKGLDLLMILMICIFSVWQTAADIIEAITGNIYYGLGPVGMLGGQSGYTIVNFLLCYLLGAWLCLSGFAENVKKKWAALVLVLNIACIFCWSLVSEATAWEYCNPLLIAEAASVFILFKRMKLQSKAINLLAKGSFTCYLVHEHLLPHCRVEWAVAQSFPIMLVHIAVVLIGIYLVSWVIDRIYHAVLDPLFRWIGSKTGEIKVSEE